MPREHTKETSQLLHFKERSLRLPSCSQLRERVGSLHLRSSAPDTCGFARFCGRYLVSGDEPGSCIAKVENCRGGDDLCCRAPIMCSLHARPLLCGRGEKGRIDRVCVVCCTVGILLSVFSRCFRALACADSHLRLFLFSAALSLPCSPHAIAGCWVFLARRHVSYSGG